jgi:hypothetical protein
MSERSGIRLLASGECVSECATLVVDGELGQIKQGLFAHQIWGYLARILASKFPMYGYMSHCVCVCVRFQANCYFIPSTLYSRYELRIEHNVPCFLKSVQICIQRSPYRKHQMPCC